MAGLRQLTIALFAFAASAASTACYRTNAPPMRTGGFGAAGRVEGGEASFGIAPSARAFEDVAGLRFGLEPSVVVGLSDEIAVEAGGSFAVKQQATGFGGVRLTIPESVTRRRFAVDFGLGGGAGVGGIRCSNEDIHYDEEPEDYLFGSYSPSCDGANATDDWDGLDWHERAAGGGYFDIGFSWRVARVREIYFFLRPRVQVSAAEGVPLTTWVDLVFGPQFKFGKVDIHAGLTPTVYTNEWQTHFLLGFEIGLDFTTM